jgi:hypothetical protein
MKEWSVVIEGIGKRGFNPRLNVKRAVFLKDGHLGNFFTAFEPLGKCGDKLAVALVINIAESLGRKITEARGLVLLPFFKSGEYNPCNLFGSRNGSIYNERIVHKIGNINTVLLVISLLFTLTASPCASYGFLKA